MYYGKYATFTCVAQQHLPKPARTLVGRVADGSMYLDICGAKHDTTNDTKEIGAAGDFVVWHLLSRSPLATTPRKEARFLCPNIPRLG